MLRLGFVLFNPSKACCRATLGGGIAFRCFRSSFWCAFGAFDSWTSAIAATFNCSFATASGNFATTARSSFATASFYSTFATTAFALTLGTTKLTTVEVGASYFATLVASGAARSWLFATTSFNFATTSWSCFATTGWFCFAWASSFYFATTSFNFAASWLCFTASWSWFTALLGSATALNAIKKASFCTVGADNHTSNHNDHGKCPNHCILHS